MDFIELQFKSDRYLSDILIAELAELGFDTFQETEEGFNAYIDSECFREEEVEQLVVRYSTAGSAQYTTTLIPKENWNTDWEKNYPPIELPGKIRVRASFHVPDESFPLEIIINPKMSFGTGHHATTQMMLELLLDTDLREKSVIDLGTGTGILAIVACKLGAAKVNAVDIDEWCIENSRENLVLNSCEAIEVRLGTVKDLGKREEYDLVLANINKNILLEEMPRYSELLPTGGLLYLSGFYETDLPDVSAKAEKEGFTMRHFRSGEGWVAVAYQKNQKG